MSTRVSLLSAVILLTAIAGQRCFAEESPLWSRGFFAEGGAGKDGKRLELITIQQGELHLSGTVVLYRAGTKGETRSSPLIVQGHTDRNGLFSPNVLLEVGDGPGDGPEKKWKTIESSLTSQLSVTLTVDPATPAIGLVVILDAFQPFIGKYKVGRITLQTGEEVRFPLSVLSGEGYHP